MSADLIEIVIFAMIAGFVALRLIHTFGRDAGDEQPTPSDNGSSHRAPPPRDGLKRNGGASEATAAGELAFLHDDPKVRASLAQISRRDRGFEPATFLDGAGKAYEMILAAFWAGDRDTLAPFVDDDVLANFAAAIEAREAVGETLENRLAAIEKAEIVDAAVADRQANITIQFTAQIIVAKRDRDGTLIEGSLADTHTVKDRWTFSRTLGSRDPNWTLIETASAD